MSDEIKEALLDGSATILTKLEILPLNENEDSIVLTEVNSVVSWDYEDFRYVKDEGFIGQFVARQVNGVVKNIDENFSMTDREFVLSFGVKINDTTTWFSLGNFLVTKVTDDDVNDKTSFESLDYTKKFNQPYVDTITYPCTALQLAQNVCSQCGCTLGNTNFKHNDWIITGNAFTNGESCREVMKAIGKLAYSWVRVAWDNKVYLDFTVKTTTDEYDKITNHEYYSLTTQKEKFGAVNRVVIGYKDINGEQTKVEDTVSIEANGVNEIDVYDNPLVYNQELREQAIVGADDLFGLEYLPLEMETVGHPWLQGYELIEVKDMDGVTHKTIPFDRTIEYFGHIKTKINVTTSTKTNNEYAYDSSISGRLRKTEISVNKIDGEITEIIQEQTETTEKLNETISTVEETKQTISSIETTVEDITTTTQTVSGENDLHLEDALEINAIEYHVVGKSEQNGIPTPDVPVEITSIANNTILNVEVADASQNKKEVSVNLSQQLCSLGNVTDTLEISNNQAYVTKNIINFILGGTLDYTLDNDSTTPNYIRVYTTVNNTFTNNNIGMNNRLTQRTTEEHGDYEYLYFAPNTNNVYIQLLRSRLSSEDVDGVKEYLTSNPIIAYGLASTPIEYILENVAIPLFDGTNDVSLVSDLETSTSIKYYRKTAISDDYVVQQQLDQTNQNLSETDNKVNQAQSDIDNTNTNLNNNYYNKDQIDTINSSTEQVITQLKNTVETTTNATNLQISIIEEQLKNGVTQVVTETGYRFDKDGLSIQKTGSEMSSLLDNDGLVVKRNSTEVLTVRSSGVETENLNVRTYFTIGDNTRIEDYRGGTGFFHIG